MSPKIYTRKDCLPEDLLQYSVSYYQAAKILFEKGAFDSAGYLAHMSLELMLKAWLLHEKDSFSNIHSLKTLAKKLKNSGLSLNGRQKQTLSYLSKFEHLRYPNRKRPIGIGEEAIEQVTELGELIWQQLPDELYDKYEKIPFGTSAGRILMERPSHIPRNLKLETGIKG